VILWPLKPEGQTKEEINDLLGRAEFTAYQEMLAASELKAILNEKMIPERTPIKLPKPHRARIIPDEIYEKQKHPDLRIARRAAWFADLARIITERDVSIGLRRTLYLQTRRLAWLAEKRLNELEGRVPSEKPGEET